MFGGFPSPQSGVRPSPQTHGFSRGNVRFEEQPTVHCFPPSDSATDSSSKNHWQSPRADYSEIKPGMTPILPDERSIIFARWCDERRRRVNDSEEFRRKKTGASHSSSRAMVVNDARAGIDGGRKILSLMSPPPRRRSPDTKLDGQPGHRASDYCLRIVLEQRLRFLAPQTRHGLSADTVRAAPALSRAADEARAAELLEQTSRGIRRWIGFQVLRHVVKLMDQVEKDEADGLHKKFVPNNPAPAAAAGAFSGFGAPVAFGGNFGAPGAFGPAPAAAAPSAAETEKARQEELKRGNALDRKSQVVCLCVGAASRCTLKGSPRAQTTPCAGGCGRFRALATAVK